MSDKPESLLTSHKKVADKILADNVAYKTLINNSVADHLQCDINFQNHSVDLGEPVTLWFNALGMQVDSPDDIKSDGFMILVGPPTVNFHKELQVPADLMDRDIVSTKFYSNDDFYIEQRQSWIYRKSLVYVCSLYRKSNIPTVDLSFLNAALPTELSTLTDVVPLPKNAFLDITTNCISGEPVTYVVACSDMKYIFDLMVEISDVKHASTLLNAIGHSTVELGNYFFNVYVLTMTLDDLRGLIK